MKQKNIQKFAGDLLGSAGIEINGKNPWDIQIHHPEFYHRVFKHGSLGLGESYLEQWWDCKRLDQFFERIIEADLESKIKSNVRFLLNFLAIKLINFQSRKRAFQVGKKHYDLGNELFERMLDKAMNYTCGYWRYAKNLDEAQLHKLELVCQKLKLKPGMKILDIGCGFGAFAKYAAENYDAQVVGITISKEQQAYARENCKNLPVEIRFEDYRELPQKAQRFDRIVSLGMFEHVGHLNYLTYMKVVNLCLKDNGLFILHTIGSNKTTHSPDAWVSKYIFPNGILPSIQQIGHASEELFIMEDWHNFGADYDLTLMAWHDNFNKHWNTLSALYDEQFYRMWRYYLLSCAGMFRARSAQLWQIVFSKKGIPGGYHRPFLNI